MVGEVMNSAEKSEQKSPMKEVADKAKELSDATGDRVHQKYEEIKEDRASARMLNDMKRDHENRGVKVNNEIVAKALDTPEKENVKTAQDFLGYKNQEGKNFYNPIHHEKMKGWSDGQAWPFTLAAINNTIADQNMPNRLNDMKTIKEGISQTEWVKDFIWTLHPYFLERFKNADPSKLAEGSNEKNILQTMQGILKGEVKAREDIQKMQIALRDSKCYPATHQKDNKDGVPGPYTQVALQSFIFKNLKSQTIA